MSSYQLPMTNYQKPLRLLVVLLASACASRVTAQEAGVELQLESNTLEVGEVVDGQLVCTNVGQPQLPAIQAPDGLEIQIVSPNPAQFSQMSIVNGRRSQKVTYTYSLRVVGKKEGVYTIGPIPVAADGRTYQTSPLQVTVQKAAESAQNEGDRLVFVRMTVEPRSLYVTQSFTATLIIGIRKVTDAEGRVVELDNLLEFVDGSGSDTSVFPRRFSSTEQWMTDSSGKRHPYVLHRASKEVRAEQVGPFSVGPVFIKMNYPTAFRRGFFGRLEATRSRKETARAEAIVVDVKGPPEQGRPADFAGAIGQYTLSVEAKPTRVEHGRPVTLSIAIGGEPLEGLAGPDLSRQSELASRFDFATDELTGDVEGRAKVFRRAVFPKQPGEQTIPPLTWSFFDPKAEAYVSLSSKPIPITVDPRAPGGEPLPSPMELAQSEPNGKPLTVLSGGIAPNYVDPRAVLADQSLGVSAPVAGGFLTIWPLTWAAIALTVRHRRRVTNDTGYARRRRAKSQAFDGIHRALRHEQVSQKLGGLGHALTGFICDRFDLPPGEMTPQEVHAVLTAHRLDSTFADEVATFLESCDAVRYAPGIFGALSPEEAAAKTRRWIAEIDRNAR